MATFNGEVAVPSTAVAAAPSVSVFHGEAPPVTYTGGYDDGYVAGERYGFSSPREETMDPIRPGETNVDKKTRSFRVYTSVGVPASGEVGEGAVCIPAAGELQVNRDLAGFVNAAGAFSHVGDGMYRYTFDDAEVAEAGGEGNIWVRVKKPGFRTAVMRVPLRAEAPSANTVRDAVLNSMLENHATVGSVADGIAIAAGLLQGNFFMDNVLHDANGQTSARIRVWRSAAAMGTPTPGALGLEGAFAAFLVTTTYSGPNKIATHVVARTA